MPDNKNFDDMVDGAEEAEQTNSAIQLANFSTQLSFDNEDIVIPRLRLAQGLTTEVQDGSAKPGQWLLTGFEPKDELTIVPLMMARNRTLRDDEGSVLCKSTDGLNGVGAPGGVCAVCPKNKWTEQEKGKPNLPPECTFSYAYIVYVKEFETMALVEFRRTSIQAGKTLNTMVAQRNVGNFAVKLKSAKQTGKRGTFYQIVVQPVPADADLLNAARQFMGM